MCVLTECDVTRAEPATASLSLTCTTQLSAVTCRDERASVLGQRVAAGGRSSSHSQRSRQPGAGRASEWRPRGTHLRPPAQRTGLCIWGLGVGLCSLCNCIVYGPTSDQWDQHESCAVARERARRPPPHNKLCGRAHRLNSAHRHRSITLSCGAHTKHIKQSRCAESRHRRGRNGAHRRADAAPAGPR